MKKIIVIVLALITLLTGCSSRKNPVMNDKIREDCLSIQDIHNNLTELISFKIDSTALITDSFVVRVTIDFKTELDTVKAVVIMNYTKYKKSWDLNSNHISIVSVISQEMPSLEKAIEKAQTLNFLYNSIEAYTFQDVLNVTENSNSGNGIWTYDFSIEGSEEHWNYHSEGSIKARYTLGQRWTYEVSKESYSESADWSGVYHFFPGNTMVTEESAELEKIVMTMTGGCDFQTDSEGTMALMCDIKVSFTYKGIEYKNVEGQMNWESPILNSRNITFVTEDSLIFELSMAFEGRVTNTMVNFTGTLNSIAAAVHKVK